MWKRKGGLGKWKAEFHRVGDCECIWKEGQYVFIESSTSSADWQEMVSFLRRLGRTTSSGPTGVGRGVKMDEARPRRRHLCCSWHCVQLFAWLEPWYGSVHSPAVHSLKAIGTDTGRAIYFIGLFFFFSGRVVLIACVLWRYMWFIRGRGSNLDFVICGGDWQELVELTGNLVFVHQTQWSWSWKPEKKLIFISRPGRVSNCALP